MGWNKRDHHRRRMLQCNRDIDKALFYLKEFHDISLEAHPDLAHAAVSISQSLVFVQESILKLRKAF